MGVVTVGMASSVVHTSSLLVTCDMMSLWLSIVGVSKWGVVCRCIVEDISVGETVGMGGGVTSVISRLLAKDSTVQIGESVIN